MPPKTRKRRSSAASTELDQDATPAAKRTSRAAPKTTQNSKSKDEIEKKSLNMRRSSRKLRTSVPETKQAIRKQADELIELIGSHSEQMRLCDGDRIPGMNDLVSATSNYSKRYDPLNNIYQQAHECISDFQRMIDEYEALNKANHSINKPTGLRWEQDSKELIELNQKAMAISLRTLRSNILTGTRWSAPTPPTNTEDDIEQYAWEILVDGRPKSAEETWGAVAQELMRVLSGAMKLLPGSNGPWET